MGGEHLHELVGILVGQRSEKYAANDGEHGDVGADADRERENGHHGESGCSEEDAKAVANILQNSVHVVLRALGLEVLLATGVPRNQGS
jgi:hypothetical protein